MSNFLNLNWNDFGKGLIVAVLTVIVAGLGDILATGAFPNVVQLKGIGMAALAAGVAYILKNLFTNSDGQFMKAEKPKIAAK